jgi:glycolate dehydrogenase FAD-binding subunit
VLNAQGEDLRFGGQVMKNVAGFDLSRLMAGSFGTLAVILEVSLKVLPRPEEEQTVRLEMKEAQAIDTMNRWAGQPLPISASCYSDGALYARLAGSNRTVAAARERLGGEALGGANFWSDVREHRLAALQGRLWRVSVRPTIPPLELPGQHTVEWNGSLRWLATAATEDDVHRAARNAGGHATLFRGASGGPIMRLDSGVLALNRRIKQALDPVGIFGPHRLHAEF